MKTLKGDIPAMPTCKNPHAPEAVTGSLTKREQFAMAAMQGLCAHGGDYYTPQGLASDAVMFADTLLAELDKPSGGE